MGMQGTTPNPFRIPDSGFSASHAVDRGGKQYHIRH